MNDDLDTPSAMPALEELAELALGSDDPALAAAAGRAVRDLAGRILGLRLSAAPVAAGIATA
jgi:hypothetical protein